ncbi:low molecular weight phosphatase family protein [Phenylobacterium sp.]|uniref:arsenate-mycothiol transferase ArsC n=1 Tax=Phenylobacterium sp. TaxID=1871053 RepID=UPI002DF368EC|nr:low molecular weight phosphatase family protein [Phenylobacterium sp.]
MPGSPPASQPGAVLFACNFNRVRSPMAEALLKRLVGDRVYVDSCGLKYPPVDPEEMAGVDPFVAAVMAEVGCDLSRHRVKTFEDLEDNSFDLVISLTPQSQHRAVEMARGRAAEIEYWPVFDPTLTEGSREARLSAYRDVRDALAARIAKRFAP